jgi:hypothetical protein
MLWEALAYLPIIFAVMILVAMAVALRGDESPAPGCSVVEV